MALTVYQGVISGFANNQLIQNVLFWEVDETGSFTAAQYNHDLITNWTNNLLTPWLNCAAAEYSLASIKFKRVTGSGGPTSAKLYTPGAITGLATGSCSDTAQAGILTSAVVLNAKNVTGKVFLGGCPAEFFTLNGYTTAGFTAINALGVALNTSHSGAVTSAPLRYTIYNRATGAHTNPSVSTIGDVIGLQGRRRYPI